MGNNPLTLEISVFTLIYFIMVSVSPALSVNIVSSTPELMSTLLLFITSWHLFDVTKVASSALVSSLFVTFSASLNGTVPD